METRNNGWIHRKSRLPGEADGDQNGKVLAWHAFQDAIVVRWDQFPQNHFHVYWMPIADLDDRLWIRAMERLPTVDDADKLNCVLVLDQRGQISVTGYHQLTSNRSLMRWRRLPEPPSDAKELRKMD